jgi:hypothetical protein
MKERQDSEIRQKSSFLFILSGAKKVGISIQQLPAAPLFVSRQWVLVHRVLAL